MSVDIVVSMNTLWGTEDTTIEGTHFNIKGSGKSLASASVVL
jgi:hypothetical protein